MMFRDCVEGGNDSSIERAAESAADGEKKNACPVPPGPGLVVWASRGPGPPLGDSCETRPELA
jgi:hypothetical protein